MKIIFTTVFIELAHWNTLKLFRYLELKNEFTLRSVPPFLRSPLSRKKNFRKKKSMLVRAIYKYASLLEFRIARWHQFFSLILFTRATNFAERRDCSLSKTTSIEPPAPNIYIIELPSAYHYTSFCLLIIKKLRWLWTVCTDFYVASQKEITQYANYNPLEKNRWSC